MQCECKKRFIRLVVGNLCEETVTKKMRATAAKLQASHVGEVCGFEVPKRQPANLSLPASFPEVAIVNLFGTKCYVSARSALYGWW